MPAPSAEYVERMGPPVAPFERIGFSRDILPGEEIIFVEHIIDLSEGLIPNNILRTSSNVISNGPEEARYLWIIDPSGLKILLERIENPYSSRRKMVHTNITDGANALQGGELWFSEEGKIYINNRSGRYGANTLKQREAILEYFRAIGFDVEQIF